MKIVVLAAGTSTERAVSIVSGTGICKALRGLGHQAVLLDIFFGWKEVDPDFAFDIEYDVDEAVRYINSFNDRLEEEIAARREFFGPNVLELCRRADIVFLALHGANGEDGKVQAAFDLLGIRYTGTDYLSSAICMDKSRTKQVFHEEGIPAPRGITVFRGDKRTSSEQFGMELPLIVKPCCGGSSVGVSICHTDEELAQGIEIAFDLEESAIIEEYIEGDELTCAVIDREAYPIVLICPKTGYYDYRNKYQAGCTDEFCPAPIPEEKTREIQETALKGYDALGISGYARFDFLMRYTDKKIYCLECNTLPGMTPTSLVPLEASVVGMDYPALCEKLIQVSMKKYEK